MSDKDIRYSLLAFWDETVQNTLLFKNIKRSIVSSGYFGFRSNGVLFKVYTPELAYLLQSKLNVFNTETKKETSINGWKFFDSYKNGYAKGKKFFKDNFKLTPDILYSSNAKYYVRDLHQNYFHTLHEGHFRGWGKVKKSHPLILTKKAVYNYGHFSGIVDEVDKLVKKHISLFREFDKCEESESLQSTKTQNDKKNFIAKEYALAYIFDLDANGKQLPTNRIEGGYAAKEIKEIGKKIGFDKPDTFYRAVKEVCKYDRNDIKDLKNISKDWLSAVKTLSTNWTKTKQYLQEKDLIRE